jgi:hypothetical protein
MPGFTTNQHCHHLGPLLPCHSESARASKGMLLTPRFRAGRR